MVNIHDHCCESILSLNSDLTSVLMFTGVETSHSPAEILSRRKRNSGRNHPHRINEKTRYVELVLVNDHAEVSNYHFVSGRGISFWKYHFLSSFIFSVQKQLQEERGISNQKKSADSKYSQWGR